ncbi:MAG: hypothetical protein A2W91_11005 [Bacteroidetes bacterium GWF2_38_335]|nr:MAG: hypothetical protein A2W91_11005 [Bacteroidetes bacterium GWF2_38_335]OFY81770.1 MAG: hypothetical protein A2281_06035 [Bacteroidetes bacterium RIFOXYA12_FULL_38_20]HBS87840.1 hypothetical protein [Bacteroidales bacterium]
MKRTLLLCISAFLFIAVNSQTINKAIGIDYVYMSNSSQTIQTSDGNFVSMVNVSNDIMLLKMNSAGDTLWTKVFGGTDEDYGYRLQKTSTGDLIVAGFTKSFGVTGNGIYVVKMNSSGTILWSRTFSPAAQSNFADMNTTSDGGCVILYEYVAGAGNYDFMVVKVSASGVIEFCKQVGGTSYDRPQAIIQTSDGGYLACGTSNSSFATGGQYDGYFFKLDASGNLLWEKTYGGAAMETLYDVVELASGRFVFTGSTSSAGEGQNDIYILETYSTGSLYNDRTVGRSYGNDYGFSIKAIGTDYYIFGETYDETDQQKSCLLKMPSGTSVSWAKVYNNSFYNNPEVQLCVNSDNSFCFSFPNSNYSETNRTEINIIKTDVDGNSGACDDDLKYFVVTNPTYTTTNGGSTVANYTFTQTTVTTLIKSNSYYHITDVECDPSRYQNTVGHDFLDCNRSMIMQTRDGGYLLSGEPWNNSLVQSNQTLLKLTYDNQIQWQKSYAWDYLNTISNVFETNDGGYIFGGFTSPDEDSDDRCFASKVNNSGEIVWTKRFGGTVNNENIAAAIQLRNSNYLFGGKTDNYGAGSDDFYVICTDESGTQLWTKTYGAVGYQELQAMIQSYDGGYLFAGTNSNSGAGGNDIQLVKTDASGNVTWTKLFGTANYEYVRKVIQVNDGGYVIVGKSGIGGFITKITSTGTISWSKTFSQYADFNDVIQDNSYLYMAGYINTGTYSDASLSKFDLSGNHIWTKTYGSTSDDIFTSIDRVNDKGFILCGYTYNFTPQYSKYYLVKTDYDGHSADCHEATFAPTVNTLTFTVGTATLTTTSNNGTASTVSLISSVSSAIITDLIPELSVVSENVNCFGGSDGSINVTVDGGGEPISYDWSTGSHSQDLTGLAIGTYNMTLTDDFGCVLNESVVITQPTLLTAGVSSTNVTCYNGTNGTGTVSPSGGTPPYAYYWSNGGTTATITNLYPATFFVNVVDANGCAAATNSITITQPAILSSSVTGSDATCYGDADGDANLTVTGGTTPYTYVWTGGYFTQDLTNVLAGTYNVTVTDACSGHTYQTVIIAQPEQLSTSPISFDVSCYGGNDGEASVSATGGKTPYSYNWSVGGSSSMVSGLTAGTYYVTVADGCGDQSVESVVVDQPDVLAADVAGTDVSCYGYGNGQATVSATGGTTPYLYSWSNGQHTQTAVGLFPGTYIINVVDANGCLSSDIIEIGQPDAIELELESTNAGCGFDNGMITVYATGGSAPYDFLWSNSATTENISGIGEGSYYVTVTDNNGCEQYDNAEISVAALPVPVCIVTVDPVSGKNLVVWEKTTDQQIAYYNVYKQSYTGEFDYLASIDYDSQSICLDGTSDPQIHSDKYEITVVDTCGNESELSSYHKTLHLNVSPSSTTAGYALTWNHYEGFSFTTYRIFRGTAPDNLVQIDSIAYDIGTFTYTDITALDGIQYFYQVAAVKPGPDCLGSKDLTGPYSQSVSNLEDNGIATGISPIVSTDEQIRVYPNPFNVMTTVEFTNPDNKMYELSIFDVTGKVVRRSEINSGSFTIEKNELTPGYYMIELSGENVFRTKIIVR